MRLGLLSDAHGNPIALQICLESLHRLGVDRLFHLGDAVGYLPGEREVVALLRKSRAECLRGNHEGMLLGEVALPPANDRIYRIVDARSRMVSGDFSLLSTWPTQRIVDLDDRRLLLVHGSPSDPSGGYVYPDSDLSAFDGLPFDAVFMGHTHYPFVARRQGVIIANIGSCGLPRDQGNLLAFAVYDTQSNNVVIYRKAFNVTETMDYFTGFNVAEEVYQCFHRSPRSPVVGIVL
jgi:putative phosphoesterase